MEQIAFAWTYLVLIGFGFAAALLRCGSGVSRASPNPAC
jgi:hypothetical protein